MVLGWLSPPVLRASAPRVALFGCLLLMVALLDYVVPAITGPVPGWIVPRPPEVMITKLPMHLTLVSVFAGLGRFGRQLLQHQRANAALALMQARADRAHTQAVKARLQPEFLTHCLAAISRRMREDPEAADRLLLDVSDLLRQTLARLSPGPVPLYREVEYLETYFNVARATGRTDARLRPEIDPALQSALIPSASLSALLERLEARCLPCMAGGDVTVSSIRGRHDSIAIHMACGRSRPPTATEPRGNSPRYSLVEHLEQELGVHIREAADASCCAVWLELPLVLDPAGDLSGLATGASAS